MKIKKIRIRSFKNINDISLDLDDMNLLVGGNNAGKSSVIQGIHFTISALRSAKMHGKSANMPASTLGVNQFTFLPTQEIMEIHHRWPMTQDYGPKFDFQYLDEDGDLQDFRLSLFRGKNANISLNFPKNSPFFRAASDVRTPFSVYVPGLAGIPLAEERRANSIVQTGIAQGDANLFLRNVLHRLEKEPRHMAALRTLMRNIFPKFAVETKFDENLNQYISSKVRLGGSWTPLEMAGTGCLQALQLAAYVILYEPKLLLLDEPDAHLHPGNQKLLVELLFSLSDTAGTQIILASHSRHVFDSIQNNPLGSVYWLSAGDLVEDLDADVGLLLELGALDRFEELKSAEPKVLVFAEDEKTKKLEILLLSNGWDLEKCRFISFNGVDNLEATKIVVEYFLSMSEEARVFIYRDGDGMTPNERAWALERYANILPERSTMFISTLTDIEHFFCSSDHVAEICEIDGDEAFTIIEEVIDENQAKLSSKITRKREDLKFKILRTFEGRENIDNVIGDRVSFHYSLGKIILPKIENRLRELGHNFQSLLAPSPALRVEEIEEFEMPE